jgi:hypothetical protein
MPSGERSIGHRDASRDVQLDLCPSLFLGRVDDGLVLCLCTGFDGIAVSIVPNNGGDLGVSCLVFLSRESALRDHVSPRILTGGGKEAMEAGGIA